MNGRRYVSKVVPEQIDVGSVPEYQCEHGLSACGGPIGNKSIYIYHYQRKCTSHSQMNPDSRRPMTKGCEGMSASDRSLSLRSHYTIQGYPLFLIAASLPHFQLLVLQHPQLVVPLNPSSIALLYNLTSAVLFETKCDRNRPTTISTNHCKVKIFRLKTLSYSPAFPKCTKMTPACCTMYSRVYKHTTTNHVSRRAVYANKHCLTYTISI